MDMLDLLKVAAAKHNAHLAAAPHCTLKGLDQEINPDCPPKNYKGQISSFFHLFPLYFPTFVLKTLNPKPQTPQTLNPKP